MDSITHIALGACMGEAFAGKKLGRKAMLWGALAQSIPDIDFVANFWQPISESLLTHRGLTHSILFAVIATALLALSAEKFHRPHNISLGRWTLFFGAAILIHIFLDGFNNYGVGWFEPFSHYRISFNVIYVADPFFSIVPGIALVALIILKKYNDWRKFWWKAGLLVPALYLSYCVVNKMIIDYEVKKQFSRDHLHYDRFLTTPAPLQNWVWCVVAGSDSGFYVGYLSVFDKVDHVELKYFPQQKYLLDSSIDQKEAGRLIQFSQGYFTIEKKEDTLVFNDLRFGQILGWENQEDAFVFHYYLAPRINNAMVVQRGRFAKWDWNTFKNFWKRIRGN